MAHVVGQSRRPLWTWPFVLVWRLVTVICNLTGILLAIVFGLLLMMVGLFLTLSVAGAVVGIPLFIFGLFLLARAIY